MVTFFHPGDSSTLFFPRSRHVEQSYYTVLTALTVWTTQNEMMQMIPTSTIEQQPWSCPVLDHPLLLFLLWRLFVVYAGGRNGRRIEHSCPRRLQVPGVPRVGNDAPGFCGVGEIRAQGVLPVLLAQIPLAPDTGAHPDANDGDYHDDEEDHPLVMRRKPAVRVSSTQPIAW